GQTGPELAASGTTGPDGSFQMMLPPGPYFMSARRIADGKVATERVRVLATLPGPRRADFFFRAGDGTPCAGSCGGGGAGGSGGGGAGGNGSGGAGGSAGGAMVGVPCGETLLCQRACCGDSNTCTATTCGVASEYYCDGPEDCSTT